MAGDTVTLTCSVSLPSGVTGTPVFQWEGPGVTSTPANPTTSGGMVSSDLTLSEISTSQAGLYTCTATLDGFINTSTIITVQSKQKILVLCKGAFLNVHVVPNFTPFITTGTDKRTAGTILTLTCNSTLRASVDTSAEMVAVIWTVNGSAVATSEDSRISVAGVSLIFSPLTTSDSGNYTCAVDSNNIHVIIEGGAKTSPKADIIVQSKYNTQGMLTFHICHISPSA